MTFTILFYRRFLLFSLTFFFYTSRGHQTQTQNTESMGTLYDNRKPAYLVEQRATLSHTDPRLPVFSNSQLRRYLEFTPWNLASGNTGNKPAVTKFHYATFYTTLWRGNLLVGTQEYLYIFATAKTDETVRIRSMILKKKDYFAQMKSLGISLHMWLLSILTHQTTASEYPLLKGVLFGISENIVQRQRKIPCVQ